MLQKNFLIFFLFNASIAFATSDAPKKEDLFLHMHQIFGCPENSICTKEIADDFIDWHTFTKMLKKQKISFNEKAKLINEYKDQKGLPFDFFLLNSSSDVNLPFAAWDGEGSQKNLKKSRGFIRHFRHQSIYYTHQKKKLSIKRDLKSPLLRKVLVERKDKIQDFHIPIGYKPYYIDKGAIYLLYEINGHYYTLKFFPSGNFRTIPYLSQEMELRETPCTQNLESSYKKNLEYSKIFPHYKCYKPETFTVKNTEQETKILISNPL